MADIAELGFLVNTRPLKKGEKALDSFAKKGEQTEKRINASFKNISNRSVKLKNTIGLIANEFINIAESSGRAKNEFLSDTRQMRTSAKNLNNELSKTSGSIRGFGSTSSLTTTNAQVKAVNSSFLTLNKTLGLVATTLIALGAVRLTRELIQYSDAWKNVNSQLRQVVDSESEVIRTRKRLFDLTKETRSGLSNTINLFSEITRSTNDLGLSQDQVIDTVRTLNNLFLAGGKPIAESAGAIRQLTQGFAAGALRGDEFNSVAEGAPRIMDAIGASLKQTRGELREFAATGGITAKILVDSLESYKETAQKLADQTAKTFGQSLIIAKANTTKFVGESESLNNIFGTLGETIESLSENLGALADAGETFLGVIVVGLSPAMLAYVATLGATARAQLLVGTTAITTSNAFGQVTVKAATATVATNALGIASKFLLGPWGLLIAAVGLGALTFNSTSDSIKTMSDRMEELRKVSKGAAIAGGALNEFFEIRKKGLEGSTEKQLREELKKTAGQIDKYTESLKKLVREDKDRLVLQERAAQRLGVETALYKFLKKAIDEVTNKQKKHTKALKSLIDKLDPAGKALRDFEKSQKLLENSLKQGMLTTEESIRLNGLLQESFDKTKKGYIDLDKEAKKLAEDTLLMNDALGEQVNALVLQTVELTIGADAFEIYTAQMQAMANDASPEMITAIEKIIKANQKLRKELEKDTSANKSAEKQIKDFEKLTKQIDKFGGTWTKTGSIIVDAFGDMSDALNDYMKRVEQIGKLEKQVAASRIIFGKDNVEVIRLEERLGEERVSAELSGIKAISSASASLFDEKTAASKAFAALNKIITIAEIALSFQKMAAGTAEASVHVANETTKQGSNALTAITSAFAAPFPINFVAGAAMIGIMGGLLGGLFGGGGGAVDPTQSRQDSQGTGSVFGSDEKSQSILKSQERFEDIAIDQLSELRGIKIGIDSLSLGIQKLAGTVVGVGLGDFAGQTGVTSSVLGGFFSKTTQNIIDEGIQFVGQTLGNIIQSGIVQAETFFTLEITKKRFFGLSRSTETRLDTQQLDDVIQQQMGDIFRQIGDTVLQSVESLGFQGLEDKLSSFVVRIGKISLEELSGEEIERELQAVFSQQADLITKFLVPGLNEFQKIGEGLFDTLTRVALEQAVFNDTLSRLGFDLSNLSTIMQIDVAQSVIDITGGLDKFSDLATSFAQNFFSEAEQFAQLEASLTDVFDSLGLSIIKSKDEFRELIEGIDITTQEGQQLLSTLLQINPALSDYIDELKEIEERRLSLLRSSAQESFSILEKSINLEKQRARAILDVAKTAHVTEIARISGLRDVLQTENQLRTSNLAEAESILTGAFDNRIRVIEDNARSEIKFVEDTANIEMRLNRENSKAEIDLIEDNAKDTIDLIKRNASIEMQAISDNSKERVNRLNDERRALDSTSNAMSALVQNINNSLGLSGSRDLIAALLSARAGDFSRAQTLDISGLSNLDPGGFSSAEQLAVQEAINRNRLNEIAMLAGDQLTETERVIAAIERSIDSEKQSSDNRVDQIKSRSEMEIDALNNQFERQISAMQRESERQIERIEIRAERRSNQIQELAERETKELKEQLAALLGLDTSILSVDEAIQQFQVSQEALEALNFQQELAKLDMLVASANDVFALHEKGYNDEISRLDTIISGGLTLINTALDIDTSVLSVQQALDSLTVAVQNIPGAPIIISIPPVQTDPVNQEALEENKRLAEENLALQRLIVKNTNTTARELRKIGLDGVQVEDIGE